MESVIVTGANGFVGKNLVKELCKKQCDIWCVVKDLQEDISCFEGLDVHIVYCDLNDIQNLSEYIKDKKGFDCFFHLAWAGSSGLARSDYKLQLDNAKACCDAARAAKQLGVRRFIGAGSVTELMYRKYLEKDGSRPDMDTCYAIGKIAAEYMTRCICTDNDTDFLWAYITNFYGEGDQSKNIINFLIDNYLCNVSPDLTDGNQRADFMYVSDVAKALIAIGERGKANNSYYIGYGNPRPLREFILIVRDSVNPDLDAGLGKKEFKGLDIPFEVLDVEKLYRDTGFQPDVPFEEGIKKTVLWKRKIEAKI